MVRKANLVCVLFIVLQTCFNKKDFLLLSNNGFSLFFELLDNRATNMTWPGTAQLRIERIPQRNLRNRRCTIHWFTHPQGKQNMARKCCYGVDLLQKDLWYCPTKVYHRLSQNVQDIRLSHKMYREKNEKQESRKKKLSCDENIGRKLPGRCAIIITIWDSDDTNHSHTKEIHRRLQISKISRKISHQIYMDSIKLFAKNEKRIGIPNTGSEDTKWRYRDRVWHRKMLHGYNEKRKTANDGWSITTKSRKKSECSEKRKPTNTWGYQKRTPSSKLIWKKKIKRIPL